jgi:gamma-glutamyltranspeptidase/glutathione hydrolase
MRLLRQALSLFLSTSLLALSAPASPGRKRHVDLSPSHWPAGEYAKYMKEQAAERMSAGSAAGGNGAVAVSYNAFAARAGLEALKQGGNAIDAAITTALTQVAVTAGAPISYFGIMSLVYFEKKSGKVYTMNAEWNTVVGEKDPFSIPGGINFDNEDSLRGVDPNGRTALVGRFMKGVEAAHKRFGHLPFAALFQPAIEVAEKGMPVTPMLAEQFAYRASDLARLPETRETFLKPDGSPYRLGETFRQPRLAATLRAVASQGADYMYGGPWGQRLVLAVQADGGRMTLEDLRRYQVIWADPLVAPIGNSYSVYTSPWPNSGGVALIEAQNLAGVSGLSTGPHWTKSPEALRMAVEISDQFAADFLPDTTLAQIYPGLDFSPEARVTQEHAEKLWARMQKGASLGRYKRTSPMHSDDVVTVDSEGNIAAITHTINSVFWGKTAIAVGGVTIGDPASFQQAKIARIQPGARLPAPTETGILFKNGNAVLGFASMGAGLHQRTFQCLLDYTRFGMSADEAINTADFYLPSLDRKTNELTITVPVGAFDHKLLDGTGYAWRELPPARARLGGVGDWVAIAHDPATGELRAASPNRNNSDALAF